MPSRYRNFQIKLQVPKTLLVSFNLNTITGRNYKFLVLMVTLHFIGFRNVMPVNDNNNVSVNKDTIKITLCWNPAINESWRRFRMCIEFGSNFFHRKIVVLILTSFAFIYRIESTRVKMTTTTLFNSKLSMRSMRLENVWLITRTRSIYFPLLIFFFFIYYRSVWFKRTVSAEGEFYALSAILIFSRFWLFVQEKWNATQMLSRTMISINISKMRKWSTVFSFKITLCHHLIKFKKILIKKNISGGLFSPSALTKKERQANVKTLTIIRSK